MKGAFMRELVAYVICAIVILYGIRESIGTAFEERTLKYSLYKVLYYFSILLTFFLVIVNLNLVMTIIIRFKLQYLTFIYNTKYTNSIILIIFFCISQNIIYVLLKLLSQPVLSSFKSSEKRAIPLCIISGFLGAGKTTLIQKLLKEALKGEKVVLIENEFGEIGIDGGFLKDAGIEVTEMNSGCICCSLVGDFGSALKEVVTQYNPDRIIIEPSGVGKLSDVIKAVQGVAEDVELDLNSFVTVADAKKCKMYMKNFGEFYNNQVEYAGSIILSRTGDVAEDKLNESVALLREHNEKAAIITTPWDELSGEQILKVMEDGNDMVKELLEEEEICPVCGGHHDHEHHHDHDHEHHHHDHDEECSCGCGHDHDHHHHHHADEVFTSWGKETPKKYNKEELDTILQKLSKDDSYGMILRSKGILQTEDGSWIQFDLVPGEYEIREGSADYTGRICVIGSKLKEDELEGLFF